MSISAVGDVIYLQGPCRVEDAETLVALLQKSRKVTLDVSTCESLHAAVVQAILAFEGQIVGAPTNGFLGEFVVPALGRTIQP
ncbi:hypothetical protein [Caulobacter sp.]|uniref:hypothetical protein n=1 Tax=Caulobacter sp. TaxID=78 RepID=UPI001B2CD813|nr:hypothetical protein [Caulobacter sp.]MBO9544611.1 hypothetical protein [Caulobacter sp.]